jgi:hypothetical protein
MTPVNYLLMDAKQAILEEQHRRFQELHREGRWVEAFEQMHGTLRCASDLLNEAILVLDEAIEEHLAALQDHSSSNAPSN